MLFSTTEKHDTLLAENRAETQETSDFYLRQSIENFSFTAVIRLEWRGDTTLDLL